MIARRRLAAEQLDARHPVAFGVRADLVIERHRLDDVEQLPLIFMDALDLDVEHRRRVDPRIQPLAQKVGQRRLVRPLYRDEFLLKRRVVGKGIEVAQRFGIVQKRLADRLANKAGQSRIALHQPAAIGHAIGLVVDAGRIKIVQVGKDRDLHQVGVQRRYAIDAMRSSESQIAHPHAPVATFVDQRDRPDRRVIKLARPSRFGQQAAVDCIDDLHVPGQQPLEQRHRPAFQRFGQQGVVGIAECAPGNVPRLVEIEAMIVQQYPHQFRHRDRRMRVIELDRRLVWQRRDGAEILDMPPDDVLQRRGREEIFLPQPQFLASGGTVGRVQHPRQRLGPIAFGQRADMVARIELVEQDRVDRLRFP